MRTREQQQKRLVVRDLLRAGVKTRAIADQMGVSISYVRAIAHELREEEQVVADALQEGEKAREKHPTDSQAGL